MKHRETLALILVVFIIQNVVLFGMNNPDLSLFFLKGIAYTEQQAFDYALLFLWYVPMFFILNYYSGDLTMYLRGYGQLLLIRGKSKNQLLFKQYGKMILSLFGLGMIELLSSYIFDAYHSKGLITILAAFMMYYGMLVCILSIQWILELFMSPNLANICANVYVISSIFAYPMLKGKSVYCYMFIVNFGMSTRSNIEHIYGSIYQTNYMLGIMGTIILATIIISIKKFQKNDFI